MRIKVVFVAISLISSFVVNGQSKEFKAAKSIDVQLSVLRELSMFYVDSVEVDKLVDTGIRAMLESLDPYTIYIPEEDEENLELMTTGSYGGIGALIKKSGNSIVISEPYEGSPAARAGLMSGDTIVRVDTSYTKYLSLEGCSSRMKGEPGTEVSFLIKRLKGGKEELIKIKREKIHFPDVAYSGIVADSVAYMRITGFTVGGSNDVRRELISLKESGKVKRVVIDLRGNGGGLLDEAVEIVSLFVPKGTLVVSSKGRFKQADIEYYTKSEPIDTITPLVVLVNSGSASSSEIVAGALQDLDRATIMGSRTFGKGLVQSIRDVGYNNKIKLTTAKYYTPSGRCVQAIDYSHRNPDGSVGNVPDSLIKPFKTKKGRVVYDGGGIDPDVKLDVQIFSRPALSLAYNEILLDYSVLYLKQHDKIAQPSEFTLTDKEYDDFVNYAKNLEFDSRTNAEVDFDRLISSVKKAPYYNELKAELDSLERKIKLSKESVLQKNKGEIKSLLEEEICNRYYYRRGRMESMIRNDAQLKDAIKSYLVN